MTNQTLTEAQLATDADVWALAGKVSQAIYAATRSAIRPAIEAVDLTQPSLFYILMHAQTLEPDPISGEMICRLIPYAASQTWDRRMVALVDKKLLAVDGDHVYRLTDEGRAILQRIMAIFYDRLGEIGQSVRERFAADDFNTLAWYLGRIVHAALNAPIDTWGTRHCHTATPGIDAPVLAHVDQALDDLNAFRDDAHLAAWQPQAISGQAWELFTFLWRGEVRNAAEMAGKAVFHGHSLEAYQDATHELLQRGWIEPMGENVYRATESGDHLRREADAITDRHFFAPWIVLTDEEVNDLRDLLARLEISLRQLTEAVPA